MKKLFTLSALLFSISATAQKLPAKVTITLTYKQVLSIDSAINAGQSWTDSKQATQWYGQRFAPFYEQVRKQMIVDTLKKKP